MPPAGHEHLGADPVARVTAIAEDGARLLLGLDPILGDHRTQVAVDAFVEQAAGALTALAAAGRHTEPFGAEPPW